MDVLGCLLLRVLPDMPLPNRIRMPAKEDSGHQAATGYHRNRGATATPVPLAHDLLGAATDFCGRCGMGFVGSVVDLPTDDGGDVRHGVMSLSPLGEGFPPAPFVNDPAANGWRSETESTPPRRARGTPMTTKPACTDV
jgi:hypothetical protein